jgi:hypothetical protein
LDRGDARRGLLELVTPHLFFDDGLHEREQLGRYQLVGPRVDHHLGLDGIDHQLEHQLDQWLDVSARWSPDVARALALGRPHHLTDDAGDDHRQQRRPGPHAASVQ